MIKSHTLLKNFKLFFLYFLLILYPFNINAKFFETPEATLRWLDKVTGRVSKLDLQVGEVTQIGVLYIQVQVCMRRPVDETPESVAFIKIWDMGEENKNILDTEIFSGWMFASSPALSALDHPVYDIWVLECKSNKLIESS